MIKPKRNNPIKIEISHKTIIFTVFFILFLKLIQSIYGVIIALFIAILIATAVYPLVNFFRVKLRIPRPISASIILLLILVGIFSSIASILPLVVTQTSLFVHRLPDLLDRVGIPYLDQSLITAQFGSLSSSLFRIALNTFSVAVFLFTIFVISFYLILERDHLLAHLEVLFGSQAERVQKLIVEVEGKLGHWVRGELFLMLTIGILTYIGLTLIGIEYAIPLAIIAGLLELVPNIGPTIAAVPAAVVGFATSPVHGMLTLGLAVLIQQLENNLIVPFIMKKAVGLHPVITIVALLVGYQLGGALLAVLALPFVLVIQVSLRHLYLSKNGEVKLVDRPIPHQD